MTKVPPKAGSVGFKVILPDDVLITSQVGTLDGVVSEYVEPPQKLRPLLVDRLIVSDITVDSPKLAIGSTML